MSDPRHGCSNLHQQAKIDESQLQSELWHRQLTPQADVMQPNWTTEGLLSSYRMLQAT